MEPILGAVLIIAALVGFGVTWRWTRDETPPRPEPDPSDSAGA